MYMWNQVNCAKNHYRKVVASSPYKQWSYSKVLCPLQLESLLDGHLDFVGLICIYARFLG